MTSKPQSVNPVRDVSLREEWGRRHLFCMACGSSGNKWGFWLTTHHLIKRPSRSDEVTNFLRLCHRCHMLAENLTLREGNVRLPNLTLAICLSLKLAGDPGEYDPKRLTVLYGQQLPKRADIPEFFMAQMRQNRLQIRSPNMQGVTNP